jgi:hypothetical protein
MLGVQAHGNGENDQLAGTPLDISPVPVFLCGR